MVWQHTDPFANESVMRAGAAATNRIQGIAQASSSGAQWRVMRVAAPCYESLRTSLTLS